MKYYYLLLIIPLISSCYHKKGDNTQKISNLIKLKKNDTVSFNDLLLEIREIDLQISYLNRNNDEIESFNPKDTFKIMIEYNSQVLNDTNYWFSIKPISRGFKILKSLSKNVFLVTINDPDEIYSVYEIFIESNDIYFKLRDWGVKDKKQSIYYYSNKEMLTQIILKLTGEVIPDEKAKIILDNINKDYNFRKERE